MKRASLVLAITFVVITSNLSIADAKEACPPGKTEEVADGKKLRDVVRTDKFVFYSAGLRVNTDGAPNSYHPLGRREGNALNTICNGIAVRPATGTYAGQRVSALYPSAMKAEKRCQTILDIFRASAAADYAPVSQGSIEWYALALEQTANSGRKGKPCIQKDGQYKGFFVAQTAVAANPSLDSCNVDRWLNSNTVPYVTLPSDSKVFSSAGSSPGDLALVHRVVDKKHTWVVAVVGDSGNKHELGEGSIALHHALSNQTLSGRPHPGNINEGITTFLFPKKRAGIPISGKSLSDPSLKQQLFELAGGESTLLACVK